VSGLHSNEVWTLPASGHQVSEIQRQRPAEGLLVPCRTNREVTLPLRGEGAERVD
jgi:hypothetical protein